MRSELEQRDRLAHIASQREALVDVIGTGQVRIGSSWENTLKVGRVRARVNVSVTRLRRELTHVNQDIIITEQTKYHLGQLTLRQLQLAQMSAMVSERNLSEDILRQYQQEYTALASKQIKVASISPTRVIERKPGGIESKVDRCDSQIDQEVKRMREERLRSWEIIKRLGITKTEYRRIVTRLLATGETNVIYQGAVPHTNYDEEIKRLRAEGLKNEEIRNKLGLTPGRLDSRITKLIKEGAVEPRSDIRSSGKGGARFTLEQVLDKYIEQNPGKIIILADIAKEIGVSRERVRQLYLQIASQRTVPPAISLFRKLKVAQDETFDQQVKELVLQGIDSKEIARRLQVTKKLVLQVKSSNYRRELEIRRSQIQDLKKRGFSTRDIIEMTGFSEGSINKILATLRGKGEVKRSRKRYKTKAEVECFKEQISQLRLESGKLTYKQIAEITGESETTIGNYVNRLIREGRIPRRHKGS